MGQPRPSAKLSRFINGRHVEHEQRASVTLMDKMNPKQTRFVKHYISNGCNGKKAAISAGYSKHTAESKASQLLRIVKVKNAIEKEKAKLETKLDYSRENLMQLVMAQAMYDGEGATHGARVSALNLLGKWTGLDVQQVKQDTNVAFRWIVDGEESHDDAENR
tara:strand:- start:180 stop:668 length:489 start_codon:yes stop_codon:yes gene_type:complete